MRAPLLEDIVSEAMDARLEDVHTAEPGWVLDYDPSSRTCSVQAAMQQATFDERGERRPISKPPCRNAQVAFPGGIVFRLKPGDPVLIVYCSAALDNWTPERSRTVDPGDDRRHDLSDPIVIPLGKTSEVPGKDEVIVEYDKVKLGNKGTLGSRSAVVRKADLSSLHTLIIAAAATLTTGGNTDGAAALTALATQLNVVINAMSTNVEAT